MSKCPGILLVTMAGMWSCTTTGESDQLVQSCYDTGHGIVCTTSSELGTDGDDVDGDGEPDELVCGDAASESSDEGDDSVSGPDDDDALNTEGEEDGEDDEDSDLADGESTSESDDDCGASTSESTDDSVSDLDGDGDGDGIDDAEDCDCVGDDEPAPTPDEPA